MATTIQSEIKQNKPFDSLQQEVLINIARTAAVLMHRMEQHFRQFGITSTQYNVLRIVNGAGPCGISQCDIASRLVAETPDVPRLLKRTETAGLIERKPSPIDKRVLSVHLTPVGARLLKQMEPHMKSAATELFPNLTEPQLRTLSDLLDAAR